MELIVLGCSGSFPTADAQCSGYLLRHEGFTVWMDAGNGTLSKLQKHVSIGDLGAIVLSHAHPDHCADLYPYFFAIFMEDRARDVYAPPGVHAKLDHLIGDDSKNLFRTRLRWHEFEAGQAVEVGPFRIEAFGSSHSTTNNTMRVTAGGKTLCYSGDTGPNPDLARAAREVDLFLCEASWTNDQAGLLGPVHCTAGEAGAAAREAGAARLALTHVWPSNDHEKIRAQASDEYRGEIALARETQRFAL